VIGLGVGRARRGPTWRETFDEYEPQRDEDRAGRSVSRLRQILAAILRWWLYADD